MKFKKKPIEVDAWQYTESAPFVPDFVRLSTDTRFSSINGRSCLYIKTLEGEMRADIGDWIIQGVKGELYPCKPDIFAATYEVAV